MTLFSSLKSVFLSVIFTLSACAQTPSVAGELHWQADGRIHNEKKVSIQTKITGVHAGFATAQGLYLSGFEIDSKGINHPTVAFVPNNLASVQYWAFSQTMTQFFRFRERLYLADISGNVLRRSESGWVQDALKLEADTRLLRSTSGDVIACHPAPIQMAVSDHGGCRSLVRGWRVELDWVEVPPVLCGDYVVVVTGLGKQRAVQRVSLSEGQVSARNKLKRIPADLCQFHF